jgi:hypothetical protein
MTPLVVVEISKAKQFAFQVAGSPKGHYVEVLSPDRADKPLDERMRNRQVGHCLHFGNLESSKVRFPPMESEQRIIIAADGSWQASPSDCTIEHPAERWTIDRSCVYTKANNLTCVLIHNDQHPMALERERFTTE